MQDVPEALRRVLAGRYEVEREIGRGGMAVVYLARDVRHERHVALKVLQAELASAVGAERFLREISVAAKLTHPNILPLHDSGAADGVLYYVMPYIDGESLGERLKREGALPIGESLSIARQVADALDHAHARGVVHRDVKPGNILLVAHHAVLADFGLADAAYQASDMPLTATGMALGTPAYMSPEQAGAERNVDGRTDVYALGCVLFEMIAGEPPFRGRTFQALMAQHATKAPPSLCESRPSCPPALDAAVQRALAKVPADRFRTAGEFIAACDAAWAAAGVVRPSAIVARERRPRRFIIMGAAAASVIAIAGIGMFATRGKATTDLSRVAVLPLENRTGDSTLDIVGELVADWVSRGLSEPGDVQVVATLREDVPAGARATRRELLRHAASRGAGTALVGELFPQGDSLALTAQMLDIGTRRILQSFGPFTTSRSDPLRAAETLRQRVMGSLSVSTAVSTLDGGAVVPPLYDAYRELLKGERAFLLGAHDDAYRYFTRAYEADTMFVYALVRAGYSAHNRADGGCATVDSLAQLIDARRNQLTPYQEAYQERLEAWCRGDWETAFRAAKRMAEMYPTSENAAYIAGRSALYLQRPRTAFTYFSRATPDYGPLRESDQGFRDWGRAHHMLGEYRRELALVDSGYAKIPENDRILYTIIPPRAALGMTAGVDSVLALAVTKPTVGADAFIVAIGELQRHGHPEHAAIVANRFASWAPNAVGSSTLSRDAIVAYALLVAGRHAESRVLLDRLVETHRAEPRILAAAGVAAAMAGDRARAMELDRKLATMTGPYLLGANSYGRAQIAASLGRRDEAVRLLEQALGEGLPYYSGRPFITLPGLRDCDPLLQPLNGFPGYEALLEPKD